MNTTFVLESDTPEKRLTLVRSFPGKYEEFALPSGEIVAVVHPLRESRPATPYRVIYGKIRSAS